MVFVHSSNSDLELDYGTLDVLRANLYERCILYSPVYEYSRSLACVTYQWYFGQGAGFDCDCDSVCCTSFNGEGQIIVENAEFVIISLFICDGVAMTNHRLVT